MMHRYFVLLSLAFFVSDVYAHKDREVVITEDGKLVGLPEQYLPAHLKVVFKILCHFIKITLKEMTHDQTNIRYGRCHRGAESR